MKNFSVITKMIPVYAVVLMVVLTITIKGNEAITTYIEKKPTTDRNCVVIDAGHGGVDGGTTSYSGILESNINLEIALRLNDLLHLLGIDTIMIRITDTSIHTTGTTIAQKKISDLRERVRIVNEAENGLLISIHQNYFSDNRYYGPQVFYRNRQGSAKLAKRMQEALNTSLCSGSNRKIKHANGIYLLDKISCDGILIECIKRNCVQ